VFGIPELQCQLNRGSEMELQFAAADTANGMQYLNTFVIL